jgi:hypothetical protein
MQKIFLKKHKHKVSRCSWKYWLAVVIELTAIILWSIGLLEIKLLNKCNPATMLVNIGGLFFTIGSFLYCKWVQH